MNAHMNMDRTAIRQEANTNDRRVGVRVLKVRATMMTALNKAHGIQSVSIVL